MSSINISNIHKIDKSGLPESVDFHFLKACNMHCRYCFATFADVKEYLPHSKLIQITQILAEAFRKITLVGGEPLLSPILAELVQTAKSQGAITCLVTNGSLLTQKQVISLPFDWITISVDSSHPDTHKKLGRSIRGFPCDPKHYLQLSQAIHDEGKYLKINTVVCQSNVAEDMSGFILKLKPDRWKIFQVLPIEGENNADYSDLRVSDDEFLSFVNRHQLALSGSGISIVPEDNRLMTGSYAMIDPIGRFFDNISGRHNYGRSILEVGLSTAWNDIRFQKDRFIERGGKDYFLDQKSRHTSANCRFPIHSRKLIV